MLAAHPAVMGSRQSLSWGRPASTPVKAPGCRQRWGCEGLPSDNLTHAGLGLGCSRRPVYEEAARPMWSMYAWPCTALDDHQVSRPSHPLLQPSTARASFGRHMGTCVAHAWTPVHDPCTTNPRSPAAAAKGAGQGCNRMQQRLWSQHPSPLPCSEHCPPLSTSLYMHHPVK